MVEDPPRSRSPPRPPRRSGPPAARGRSISPRSRSRSRSRGSRSPYSSRSRSTGSSYTGSSRSRSTGSRSSRSRSRSWSSRSRSRSVSRSRSRSRGRGKAPTGAADPNNKRIFITPISKNVTPAHLREIFGLFGKVVDVAVPPAPPPRLPGPPLVAISGGQLNAGIALVTFEKREDAEAAITGMNEGWIDGCLLRVVFAEPQHERRAAEALVRARIGRGMLCGGPAAAVVAELTTVMTGDTLQMTVVDEGTLMIVAVDLAWTDVLEDIWRGAGAEAARAA
ncbi:hypothetical protein HDU88_004724 [Geranomyces variabilis]|nr:hypothetical protein HDU88_004724 [Geranomyces variabilis]